MQRTDRTKRIGFLLPLAIVLIFSGSGKADTVFRPPSDLLPADQYRVVFASSTRHEVNFRDLTIYDQILDSLGDTIIESDWQVLGTSTLSPNARIRTQTDTSEEIPIYRFDGLRVADGYDDFWDGTLDRPVQFDENGMDLGRDFVWTGMSEFGTYIGDGMGDGFVRSGLTNRTDRRWARDGFDLNGSRNRLYGMSGVLTVTAVPEPSSAVVVGVFVACFLTQRRT